jgi:hypothetical protein
MNRSQHELAASATSLGHFEDNLTMSQNAQVLRLGIEQKSPMGVSERSLEQMRVRAAGEYLQRFEKVTKHWADVCDFFNKPGGEETAQVRTDGSNR